MISKRLFGKTADGREVNAYLLAGKGGVQMEVLDWGGKIVKILPEGGRQRMQGRPSRLIRASERKPHDSIQHTFSQGASNEDLRQPPA